MAQQEAADERARRNALHLSANLKGMDTLFHDIMIKGDGEMSRLRALQPFQEALSQLQDAVDSLTEEYITTVLEHKAQKDKEYSEFTTALEYAKAQANAESKAEIARYDALTKASLSEAMDNPLATLQMLHKANDALFVTLMDAEVSQSERCAGG